MARLIEKKVGITFINLEPGQSCSARIAELHRERFGALPFYIDGSQTIDLDKLMIYVCERPTMGGFKTEVVQR